jgi:hypothetical protein
MLLRNSHAWKTSQEPNRSLADVIRLSGCRGHSSGRRLVAFPEVRTY